MDAAMEPADQRREHRAGELGVTIQFPEPQWSPPTSGGSTQPVGHHPFHHGGAAMEPADQRREHWSALASRGVTTYAAMEPADQRREHPRSRTTRPPARCWPQWSPPTSGGSTGKVRLRNLLQITPQWSPPTSGGSTPGLRPGDYFQITPQWSPPTSGGSTARKI